jgi:hypothetical protein
MLESSIFNLNFFEPFYTRRVPEGKSKKAEGKRSNEKVKLV